MGGLNVAQDPSCFVIGPMGDGLASPGTPEYQVYEDAIQVWEKIVLAACRIADLKPLHARQISRTGEIVEQVCRHLRDSDIVIADLTGANPNVMYELGLRHTAQRTTIQIGERARLPFDISAIRTIQFIRTESGFIDARNLLAEAIRTALGGAGDPVTATRVWNELPPTPTHPQPEVPIEPPGGQDPPGFLEKLADTEIGMESMKTILTSVTSVMASIGTIADAATTEIARSDARGGGARGRLAIAERVAEQLETKAGTLEALSQEFVECVDRTDPGVVYLLERLEAEPETLKEAEAFCASLRTLAASAVQIRPTIASFQRTMKDAGTMSRSMRNATTRLAGAAGRLPSAAERFIQWRDQLQQVENDS